MPRDYKHRAQPSSYGAKRRSPKKAPTLWWRWLLVAALVVAFVVFLNMVRQRVAKLMEPEPSQSTALALKVEAPSQQKAVKTSEPEKAPQPEEPRYDFYTILPQAETVVPDYEIKTRVREELVGKSKATKYMMQAGSFRDAEDAERHKARLALLGIESRIEKAKVGDVIWHRIKVGPYDNPSSVSTIKELLQKNNIGVIVTEQGQ